MRFMTPIVQGFGKFLQPLLQLVYVEVYIHQSEVAATPTIINTFSWTTRPFRYHHTNSFLFLNSLNQIYGYFNIFFV